MVVRLEGQARLGKIMEMTSASYSRHRKARQCSSPTFTRRSRRTCAQRRTVRRSSGASSRPAHRREWHRIWAAATRTDRKRRYKVVNRLRQSSRQKEASLRRQRPRSTVDTISLEVTTYGAISQKESSTMLDRRNGRLASLATTPSTASSRSSVERTTTTTRSPTRRSMDCQKPRTSTISR